MPAGNIQTFQLCTDVHMEQGDKAQFAVKYDLPSSTQTVGFIGSDAFTVYQESTWVYGHLVTYGY